MELPTSSIDTGDDWSSGETASITLTDADANTNSLDANDLSVSDESQIIPTIRIGSPFTLGHLGYESLDEGEVKLTNSVLTAAAAAILAVEAVDTANNADIGTAVTDAITAINGDDDDDNNIAQAEQDAITALAAVDDVPRTADEYRTAIGNLGTMNITAQVTEVSDILVLTFPEDDTSWHGHPKNQLGSMG